MKGMEQTMHQVKTFEKNEVIFKEGVYERCMYEIQSGSVNIYMNWGKEDEKLLTTLEAGQFLGEIGIVEAMPRTATAIAAEDHTSLFEITCDNFSAYFQNKSHQLLAIMQHMSERLRLLTEEYLEARATIAEAINTAKNGKKQSGSLKEKIAKLVQNSIKPSFLKNNKVFEEASFLKSQENQQRVCKSFKKNEIIFREGDPANCLYDILSGMVGIYANYGTDNQSLLAELNPSEFFGEMGLLSHMPRSATAVALAADTQVLLVSEEAFSKYLQESPAKVMMIMMHLSSRIRALSKDYLEVCRLAETAATAEDENGTWFDFLAESVVSAFSVPMDPCDCYTYYRDRHYVG